MPSFFVHLDAPSKAARLVAEANWAVAVRAMVEGHDEGANQAERLVENFITRVRALASDGDLNEQREHLAAAVRAAVEAAEASDKDGVVFTLLWAAGDLVRIFNVGPHRTFLASTHDPVTIVTPQSLAEQMRSAGMVDPPPEHALVSMRIANRDSTPSNIDATEVALAADTWLITQLDDRAPLVTFTALPDSPAEVVDRLRDNASTIPNLAADWLLATR